MGIKVKAIERNVAFEKGKQKWAFVMQAELYSQLNATKVIEEAAVRSRVAAIDGLAVEPQTRGNEFRREPFVRKNAAHFTGFVKHLDGLSDDEIAELNIPTGIPLVYKLDANFKPLVAGGEYLDPEAAAAGAAAVAAQGNKK